MERKIEIRNAKESDIDSILGMIARLKKLNEEFDTRMRVSSRMEENARNHLVDAMKHHEDYVFLVAEIAGKTGGFIKADIVHRIYYDPEKEGRISEFYVMPEFRRLGVGGMLLNRAKKILHSKGVGLIAVEFPSQNMIASNFYRKLGFVGLTSIFGKETDSQE